MTRKNVCNKVVYNASYGGFGLSLEAAEMLFELTKNEELKSDIEQCRAENRSNVSFEVYYFDRHDKNLIAVVEKLGEKANGFCANLKIKNLFTNNKYFIEEDDGFENVITTKAKEWVYVK